MLTNTLSTGTDHGTVRRFRLRASSPGGTGGGGGKRENPAARALGRVCSQANAVNTHIYFTVKEHITVPCPVGNNQ